MKSNIDKFLSVTFIAMLFVFTFQNNSFATIFTINNVANAQQEVPVSAGSSGKGTVVATYDDVTNLLSYTVTYTGLLGNSTAAHFHGSALPGANAGVQIAIAITTGSTSGTKTATATLSAAQETMLLAGLMYYNVHSTLFGGGEIRGQVIPKTSFNLKVIPQGYFNAGTIQLNSSDSVKIYARNSVSPYAIKDSAKGVLSASGYTGAFAFNQLYSGSYYLVVQHRNSIETWTAASQPLTIGSSSFFYDFTDNSSKAFGSNEIIVYPPPVDGASTIYGIYSGDVNKDQTIDGSDLSAVENDVTNSLSGYVITDLTGDDFVDAGDLSIVENNAALGVNAITP